MIIKTYKYRLYPNNAQSQAINEMLDEHRHLYNQALFLRKVSWEYDYCSITYNQQSAWLTQQRNLYDNYTDLNFSSCQRTLRRLDKAFKAFYRRNKLSEKVGYPRFKGVNRFHSLEFTYNDGIKIKDLRLYVQHIGEVKIKLHRPIDGKIKTAIIKRKAGKYYACFSAEVEECRLPTTNQVVGLDMGISNLVTTSDGEFYEPPKFLRQSEKHIKLLQRKVARREKNSNRRRKAVHELQITHEHVANQRRDVSYKIAKEIVENYDIIAVEDLNTQGMMKNHHLAKSIGDASWTTFQNILSFKAEEAGKLVVKVDPKYTSQICSKCGKIVKKDLSVRVHNCPYCGLKLDRDVNAAINIIKKCLIGLGRSLQALTWDFSPCVA